jgi:predicted transcriptional regulator
MTKPTKKKTIKKYELSRAKISDRISELSMSLGDIDTFTQSPREVTDEITKLVEQLEELAGEVVDEQW